MPMSETEKVLAEHDDWSTVDVGGPGRIRLVTICICGEDLDRDDVFAAHRAHVAAVLDAHWAERCHHEFEARSTMGDPYESCYKCGLIRDLPLARPADRTTATEGDL